jgi:thioredoxin 1
MYPTGLLLAVVLLFILSFELSMSFHHSLRATLSWGGRVMPSSSRRLFAGERVVIVKENKLADVENSPGNKVLYFTADWCSPCRMIAPIFEKISQESPNTLFVKIDIDKNEELAAKYGIHGIPTFMFLKGKDVRSKVCFGVYKLYSTSI